MSGVHMESSLSSEYCCRAKVITERSALEYFSLAKASSAYSYVVNRNLHFLHLRRRRTDPFFAGRESMTWLTADPHAEHFMLPIPPAAGSRLSHRHVAIETRCYFLGAPAWEKPWLKLLATLNDDPNKQDYRSRYLETQCHCTKAAQVIVSVEL
jgi:hypothetical protein